MTLREYILLCVAALLVLVANSATFTNVNLGWPVWVTLPISIVYGAFLGIAMPRAGDMVPRT